MPKYKPGYVIIGAGHAGISAAEHLRSLEPKTRIYVIDPDGNAFYFRAALKFYIKNQLALESLQGRPSKFWKSHKLTQIIDRVSKIDKEKQTVSLQEKGEIPYIKLLIATGGTPFIPKIEGNDLKHVYPMRSLVDTKKICEIADQGKLMRIVILGGGVLGMELAESLLERKVSIDLLTNSSTLIPRMLDGTASDILRELAQKNGVTFHFKDTIQKIHADENQVANSVTTMSGKKIPCDGVFLCVGIRRNIELAKDLGLEVNHGILVDRFLQTSDPNIFAAGDVVEFKNSLENTIKFVELWGPAGKMGIHAAKNMIGPLVPYPLGCIHAYTVLWHHSFHSIGEYHSENDSDLTILTTLDEIGGTKNYFKLILKNRTIMGALMVGQPRDPLLLEHIINQNLSVPPEIPIESIKNRDFDFDLILYQ